MNKLGKYNHYLYIISRILIGIDIIYKCKDNINNLMIFLSLFLIIVINDNLRMNSFYKSEKRYYISMSISIIISSILVCKVGGYSDIFMFIIVYELILYTEGKISKLFIGTEISFILILPIIRTASIEQLMSLVFWKENILDFLMSYVGLLFYAIVLFTYRTLKKEKRKVDNLNKELELSYNKLKKQSQKIEELTIAEERNRVAGEIHDNLGHSLIALNMNLDVAEKIIDKDIIKAKELIKKSQILTKESMECLRKAVYALKDSNPRTLRDSIQEMVDNIESTGKVRIMLDMDESAEDLLPEYKDVIYSSIKESLTNSIKNGKADEIIIGITLEGDKTRINIKDNGLGCNDLVKGIGLLGIENKVGNYGGKVVYESKENEGFKIVVIF